MAKRMQNNVRALFCLVDYGHFEQAKRQLENCIEKGDVGLGYTTDNNTYIARYNNAFHEQVAKFLTTIDEPELRFFAEICLVGGPDLPMKEKEKDATYKPRWTRFADLAKRFQDIPFEPDSDLRTQAIRNLAINDNACWILRTQLAEATRNIDQGEIPKSQDTTQIALDSRIPAGLSIAWCKTGDLRPVRQFVTAINQSDTSTSSYYRREAIEQFTLRFTETVKNRAATDAKHKRTSLLQRCHAPPSNQTDQRLHRPFFSTNCGNDENRHRNFSKRTKRSPSISTFRTGTKYFGSPLKTTTKRRISETPDVLVTDGSGPEV